MDENVLFVAFVALVAVVAVVALVIIVEYAAKKLENHYQKHYKSMELVRRGGATPDQLHT